MILKERCERTTRCSTDESHSHSGLVTTQSEGRITNHQPRRKSFVVYCRKGMEGMLRSLTHPRIAMLTTGIRIAVGRRKATEEN